MTPATDPIVIAGRGSRLALAQTETIAAALRAAHPGLRTEIMVVTTTGDVDQRPFAEIGGKGLFTSEVERAVAEGAADIAVHSAKDLTAELADGCEILCVPERADPRDVVVGAVGDSGQERLGRLPDGARVGTSSMRRRALLAEARPELKPVELRGNLDTRLRKVADGEVDAAILAAAGLGRLGADANVAPLDPSWWIPAPAQGALAVEGRVDRDDLRELLAPLMHEMSHAAVSAERAFAARLEGGCSVPLGCLAVPVGDRLVISGFLSMADGSHSLRDKISGPPSDAAAMGAELADAILGGGGDEILEELRYEETPDLSAP
jgi:hydroxymethylbilane synthase